MGEQHVAIDYDYLEEDNCNFSDLQHAVEQLSATTDQNFNKIKNEKWFTRVFDLVTLSNKKDIRLANQIETIAQAQQILMEILVRLSQRDKKISSLVNEAFTNIKKLSDNDVRLAKRLIDLENQFLFGLNSELNLEDLEETELTIISGLLLEASHYYSPPSVNQQDYAHQLLTYLDEQPVVIDIAQAIQSVTNIETRKLLLQICLEYAFLHTLDFELDSEFEAFIDEFEFGNNVINDLKEKISNNYRLLGKSGFTDRYYIETLDDHFTVDIDVTEEVMGDEHVGLDNVEHLVLSRMIHVARDEELVFENKDIHINTFINVEGKLIFKNCIINYGESESSSEITLSDAASLAIINSRIICHKEKESFFIDGNDNNQITITNCEFANCGNFIKLAESSNLTVANSYIYQPRFNFIKCEISSNDSVIQLSECQLDINLSTLSHSTVETGNVFDISCQLIIDNCKFDSEDHENQNSNSVHKPFLFGGGANTTHVRDSSFNGLINIFKNGVTISECEFNNCINIVDDFILNMSFFRSVVVITNSLFIGCEELFKAERVEISNSQFKDCRNQIVSARKMTIEFCEFYNLKNDLPKGSAASSSFSLPSAEDDSHSIISKCIFDGVQIEHNFLMEADTVEKLNEIMLNVIDCEFKNVRTNRDTGVLLREYNHYYGLFNRRVEMKLLSYSNCTGLDKINVGKGVAEKVVLRSETSTGAKIGIGLAGIVAGVPGLALSYSASRLLKDDDLTKE